jgi:hypothetical protein
MHAQNLARAFWHMNLRREEIKKAEKWEAKQRGKKVWGKRERGA